MSILFYLLCIIKQICMFTIRRRLYMRYDIFRFVIFFRQMPKIPLGEDHIATLQYVVS